jgi:hypothetical protein
LIDIATGKYHHTPCGVPVAQDERREMLRKCADVNHPHQVGLGQQMQVGHPPDHAAIERFQFLRVLRQGRDQLEATRPGRIAEAVKGP